MWGYHCIHLCNEGSKTPMYIPSANTGAEHKCNCNRCFGFLEYPATWHNKHRDIQSKWSSKCSEKLYIVHSLECPPGKIKPTFLGTVNTSGTAKHFSHLLTIPLVYPQKKEWLKLSVCSTIAKLIWRKLQKSRIFLFKNKVISTCCFFLSSLTISTTIRVYWKKYNFIWLKRALTLYICDTSTPKL